MAGLQPRPGPPPGDSARKGLLETQRRWRSPRAHGAKTARRVRHRAEIKHDGPPDVLWDALR